MKVLIEALDAELDEHGYEDDDEKRGQVAHHFAAKIIEALGLREEYAVVGHHNGQIAEGCEDAEEAVESMDLYSMDAWMAGCRLVSDWANIETT